MKNLLWLVVSTLTMSGALTLATFASVAYNRDAYVSCGILTIVSVAVLYAAVGFMARTPMIRAKTAKRLGFAKMEG